jgi:hypothetical protein
MSKKFAARGKSYVEIPANAATGESKHTQQMQFDQDNRGGVSIDLSIVYELATDLGADQEDEVKGDTQTVAPDAPQPH